MKNKLLCMRWLSPWIGLSPMAITAIVNVEILVQSDKSWNDGWLLPAYPTEPPQISVVKVTVPPHSKLKWHSHPSINVGT